MNRLALSLLIVLALLLGACQPEAPHDSVRLLNNAVDAAESKRLRQLLAEPAPMLPADFHSLQSLLQRYPNSEVLIESYQGALLKRADWGELQRYLLAQPTALNAQGRKRLAMAYLKQGKYADLLALNADSPTQPQTDLELLYWQALAHYQLGQDIEAAAVLDRHWQAITSDRVVAAITLRGQLYQRAEQIEKAIETLNAALAVDPNDRTALNALSRIHYARGELAQAQALSERSAQVQAQASARETQALFTVQLINALKQQWSKEDYAAVIESARQALPLTDAQLRPVLYEYIVESHKRLGQTAAAAAASAESEASQ